MDDYPNIPKTIIKGDDFFNLDGDFLKNDGEIIFARPNCVIASQKRIPFIAFLTADLELDSLPSEILLKLFEVTHVVLQTTFSKGERKQTSNHIPKWIINFNKAKRLILRDVCVDNLENLAKLQIQHLIIQNIIVSDVSKFAFGLERLKSLVDLSCDYSLYDYLSQHLKKVNVKILSEDD